MFVWVTADKIVYISKYVQFKAELQVAADLHPYLRYFPYFCPRMFTISRREVFLGWDWAIYRNHDWLCQLHIDTKLAFIIFIAIVLALFYLWWWKKKHYPAVVDLRTAYILLQRRYPDLDRQLKIFWYSSALVYVQIVFAIWLYNKTI